MRRDYDILELLSAVTGYRALPFPDGFRRDPQNGGYLAEDYDPEAPLYERQQMLNGTKLYEQDFRGVWCFMPVYLRHKKEMYELPNAIMSIRGRKNIVETELVGRKGSVKELINIGDYDISITAFIQSSDGTYPADEIARIRELYNINESIEIISVLTDLVLDEGDRVVITDIDYPSTPGIEDGQAIRIECKSDKEFELILS